MSYTDDQSQNAPPPCLRHTALAPHCYLVIDERGQVRHTPTVFPGMQIIARPADAERLAA